jgi:hypothetical protein
MSNVFDNSFEATMGQLNIKDFNQLKKYITFDIDRNFDQNPPKMRFPTMSKAGVNDTIKQTIRGLKNLQKVIGFYYNY